MPFGEILEAAEKLPIDDQESLRDILAKRIIERRRDELSRESRRRRPTLNPGAAGVFSL